jgi:hypothetical protein
MDTFRYTRHQDEFEQVMAYYWITEAQKYIHGSGSRSGWWPVVSARAGHLVKAARRASPLRRVLVISLRHANRLFTPSPRTATSVLAHSDKLRRVHRVDDWIGDNGVMAGSAMHWSR